MPDPTDYFSSDQDPYLDPKTRILKNIPNLQTEAELEKFEEVIFQVNSVETAQYLKSCTRLTLEEWKRVHHICFSEIFEWAGELRIIRIAKGSTVFAYPENIESEADKIFEDLNALLHSSKLTLEKTAVLFAEANILHPFREGNGRTQRIVFNEVLRRVGYSVDYNSTDQKTMIDAMIHGYNAEYQPVKDLFEKITTGTAI